MWIADQWRDYELLDCGNGEKLERWGQQVLVRPDPQAIWASPRKNPAWKRGLHQESRRERNLPKNIVSALSVRSRMVSSFISSRTPK